MLEPGAPAYEHPAMSIDTISLLAQDRRRRLERRAFFDSDAFVEIDARVRELILAEPPGPRRQNHIETLKAEYPQVSRDKLHAAITRVRRKIRDERGGQTC